jgi:hypothetical protein
MSEYTELLLIAIIAYKRASMNAANSRTLLLSCKTKDARKDYERDLKKLNESLIAMNKAESDLFNYFDKRANEILHIPYKDEKE